MLARNNIFFCLSLTKCGQDITYVDLMLFLLSYCKALAICFVLYCHHCLELSVCIVMFYFACMSLYIKYFVCIISSCTDLLRTAIAMHCLVLHCFSICCTILFCSVLFHNTLAGPSVQTVEKDEFAKMKSPLPSHPTHSISSTLSSQRPPHSLLLHITCHVKIPGNKTQCDTSTGLTGIPGNKM